MKKLRVELKGFACLTSAGEFIPDPSNEGWPLVTLDKFEADQLVGTDGTTQVVPVVITIAQPPTKKAKE